MKKMMFTLIAMLTIAVQANAMSYEQARNEALFLTDKMAYELNLSDAQYEAVYEINLDYLMGVTSRYDVFGPYWERRNLDLSYVLYSWQWEALRAAAYFYRPLYWDGGYWHFRIYTRYPHRDYFYFGRPHFYASYRGGHSWHMNNGRSFYERRVDHYRPNAHLDRDRHVGMRNRWERGDYRSAHNGSSTRYSDNDRNYRRDDRRDNRGYDNSNRSRSNDPVYDNRSNNTPNSGFGSNRRSTVGSESTPSRSVGSSTPSRSVGSSTPSRSVGSSTPSRSVGSSTPSRSVGSSTPSRSVGSSTPSRSVGSSAPSRSSGNSGSVRSNGNGHFGGARR